MNLPDDIAVLEEQLEPAMRAVFAILRKTNEELTESNKTLTESNKALTEEVSKLTAQVAKFKKMLFGRKSEKLPPIQSEVRRMVDAEELFGSDGDSAASDEDKSVTEEEAEKQRRKRGRAKSEPKRKENRKLRKNFSMPIGPHRPVTVPDAMQSNFRLVPSSRRSLWPQPEVIRHRIRNFG